MFDACKAVCTGCGLPNGCAARLMEAALLEYVEKYGITEQARDAFVEMARLGEDQRRCTACGCVRNCLAHRHSEALASPEPHPA